MKGPERKTIEPGSDKIDVNSQAHENMLVLLEIVGWINKHDKSNELKHTAMELNLKEKITTAQVVVKQSAILGALQTIRDKADEVMVRILEGVN